MKKSLILLLASFSALAAKPPLTVKVSGPDLQIMPSMTFRTFPTQGPAPLSSKFTWTSAGAVGCVASGNWTGPRPTNGTETLVINTKGKYILTCYGATPDAVVNWTIPTLNTDGTALTNLAGFNLFVSTDSGAVASANPIKIDNPTFTTYTVSGLPVGMNYFAMQSYNTNGAVSQTTGSVSADIPANAIAMSRYILITAAPPEPPTEITVNKQDVPASHEH